MRLCVFIFLNFFMKKLEHTTKKWKKLWENMIYLSFFGKGAFYSARMIRNWEVAKYILQKCWKKSYSVFFVSQRNLTIAFEKYCCHIENYGKVFFICEEHYKWCIFLLQLCVKNIFTAVCAVFLHIKSLQGALRAALHGKKQTT